MLATETMSDGERHNIAIARRIASMGDGKASRSA